MASITHTEAGRIRSDGLAGPRNRNWLWLSIGAAVSLFAVDARWDAPLAAWIAPVLLLRFSRTSAWPIAITGLIVASVLQIAAYIYEMGAPFSATGVTLCLVLGVAFAIPFVADRLFAPRLGGVARLFMMPVTVAVIEFAAASLLPVGASIGTRAITQTDNLALMQIISVFGPYVIGFLIALAATVANHIWENPTRQALVGYGGAYAVVLLSILALGEARLSYAGDHSPGETVKVAGVIPPMALHEPAWAVSMANYPEPAQTRAALATPEMKAVYRSVQDKLLSDTRDAANSGAKLILWSETAAPTLEADKGALLQKISDVARENGVYVDAAVGVPYERNETFLFGPDGRQIWHYRKNHPVPGMEPNAPFKNDAPLTQTPIGRLSNVICYDGDFPPLTRVPADIMLVPGMDTPDMGYVHTMRMTRLRTIENGYSMLRADYYGVAAAFDPYGRVLGMLNTTPGKAYTMMVNLPTKGVATLYSRTGDLFAWLCLCAMLGLALTGIVRPARRPTRAALP